MNSVFDTLYTMQNTIFSTSNFTLYFPLGQTLAVLSITMRITVRAVTLCRLSCRLPQVSK